MNRFLRTKRQRIALVVVAVWVSYHIPVFVIISQRPEMLFESHYTQRSVAENLAILAITPDIAVLVVVCVFCIYKGVKGIANWIKAGA